MREVTTEKKLSHTHLQKFFNLAKFHLCLKYIQSR